jgi:SAM-dependent methyltransferase
MLWTVDPNHPASDTPSSSWPSGWIKRFAAFLRPESRVLDLACGAGRHTRFLAAAGHHVTAVDVDLDRVMDLDGSPYTRLVRADLEDGSAWPLDEACFDAVVVTNYLHRPLFPRILAAVGPGGVLLYETFARGNERFGKPSNPAFLLVPDELLDLVRDPLQVVAFEQGPVTGPRPAMVQRICAVRPDGRDGRDSSDGRDVTFHGRLE